MKALILGIGCAFALSSCVNSGRADAPGTPVATIEIKSFAFSQPELTVAAGTTVTWINLDQTAHNVVSMEGKFASKGMDTDDRYSFTFQQPGDYSYRCGLHPHMIGTVHVR